MTLCTTNPSKPKDVGCVVDGNCSLESKSTEYAFENELLYQAIEDHFERHVPWKETEYVEKSLERLRQVGHEDTWRAVVRSEEDLWERCEQLDELYERIVRERYKNKREVFDSQLADPMGYSPRTFKYMLDEVMIDRGRNGEPLLVDGQHRHRSTARDLRQCGPDSETILSMVPRNLYRHRLQCSTTTYVRARF